MVGWLRQNKLRVSLYSLVVVNILIWSFYFSLPDHKLHIKVFDVGQGDAIYVETPQGYKILIDGGPDNSVLGYLGKEIPFYSRSLDLVVLTHPQADHYTGLIEVLNRYQIGSLWINGKSSESSYFRKFTEIVKNKKIQTKVVEQGDTLIFADKTNIKVLWPKDTVQRSDPNAFAIVLYLSYGSFDAYLTGDAGAEVQPYTSDPAPIEFFKVPHHGGKEALNETYVSDLSPEISVISVGERNSYGHPRSEVVNFLTSIGSRIYRTDKDGTVEIVSDGNSWYTNSER